MTRGHHEQIVGALHGSLTKVVCFFAAICAIDSSEKPEGMLERHSKPSTQWHTELDQSIYALFIPL